VEWDIGFLLKVKHANSLKHRIIIASFAMTFVICLLFSVGLLIAFEFTEESLFEQHLENDMNTFMDIYQQYPQIVAVARENFDVYVTRGDDTSNLPDFLRDMPDYVDDIVVDGQMRDLEIKQQGNTRFYFVTEEAAMDRFEFILFTSVIIIIIIICIFAIFLGFMFSNRIIKPVTDLAHRVNKLERQDVTEVMSDTRGMDEIEILTHAIDSFQTRVTELLNREREFSSDASHELRTPLMGIQAAAENLQVSSSDQQRVTELAGRIEKRCIQMQSLIESMLYLARDPHSLENDFTSVELMDIVNDQLESATPYIENKGVELKVLGEARPVIHTSPAILRVVFGNLLKNAILHSESEEIHIELIENGFIIKDFGHGIPPELKDRLFERYSNGGGNNTHSTGIGLSLVKRLCEHYDWKLNVDSRPDVGTTITVIFSTLA
jgi:signal transduction histidine kinase